MFLDSLQILDKTNARISSFIFNYNNLDSLPARFNYSQDHWGYFNGKPNDDFAKLSAVPPNKQNFFTNMNITNANRNADYNFAKKGMLNKITFPAGGYVTFEYEANKNSTGKELGGCRVLRLKTYESATATPLIDKFIYSSIITSIDTIYYQENIIYWDYSVAPTNLSGFMCIGILTQIRFTIFI